MNHTPFNLTKHVAEYHYDYVTVLDDIVPPQLCDTLKERVEQTIGQGRVTLVNHQGLGTREVSDAGGQYLHYIFQGQDVRDHLPELTAIYHSLLPLISLVTSQDAIVSPHDRSDINIKVYPEGGGTLGEHYDTNAITVLLFLTSNREAPLRMQIPRSHPSRPEPWIEHRHILASLGLLSIIHFTEGQAVLAGTALVLLAALSWSACNLIVKQTRPGDMVAFIVWSSLFAAPPLFLMTWLAKGSAPFYQLGSNLTPSAIFSVLFQAYVTTLFGYRVWNNLMKKYPSAMVAPLSLMVPISGVATSWLMFDESIGPHKLASIGLILLGIALFINAALITNWLRARAARQADEPLS